MNEIHKMCDKRLYETEDNLNLNIIVSNITKTNDSDSNNIKINDIMINKINDSDSDQKNNLNQNHKLNNLQKKK